MIRELLFATVSLVIIYNPFSKPPQLLALTGDMGEDERNSVAKRATIIAWLIGLVVAFFGSYILEVLAIELGSFRIFGGIMLMLFGIQFGLGYTLAKTRQKGLDVAAVPLASPLLTGPGAISALMLFTIDYGHAVTLLALTICLIICFIFMRLSKLICEVLNEQTLKVISRLMGMIMVAIAVQFVTSGLGAY